MSKNLYEALFISAPQVNFSFLIQIPKTANSKIVNSTLISDIRTIQSHCPV